VYFWILCVIAFLVHTVVNHKYIGHFVMIVYFIIVFMALPQMNLENYLYRLGQSPGVLYSDMNGYGPMAKSLIWFHIYWGIAAVLMAVATNILWVRGMESGLRSRLKLAGARLTAPTKLGFGVCAILLAVVGGYIYYNTHVLNRYVTT